MSGIEAPGRITEFPLLKNAESIVDVNIIEDPSYMVATDSINTC